MNPSPTAVAVLSMDYKTHLIEKSLLDDSDKHMYLTLVLEPYSQTYEESVLHKDQIRHPDTIGFQVKNVYGDIYQHETNEIIADYEEAKMLWSLPANEPNSWCELSDSPIWFIHQVREGELPNPRFITFTNGQIVR